MKTDILIYNEFQNEGTDVSVNISTCLCVKFQTLTTWPTCKKMMVKHHSYVFEVTSWAVASFFKTKLDVY